MKRQIVLFILLVNGLTGGLAGAQSAALRSPAQQNTQPTGTPTVTARIQINAAAGAWWTDTALVARLGLTGDQKMKIENAYENHRQDLASDTALLQRAEGKLAGLLETEAVDRSAVTSQIERVIQARGELERANSLMTLEMRESLTRTQWAQLAQSSTAVQSGADERNGIFLVGNGVSAPVLIKQVLPQYTEEARKARFQGTVVLETIVRKDGTVQVLHVARTLGFGLDEQAVKAVSQWTFRPGMKNGQPVDVHIFIEVNFNLGE